MSANGSLKRNNDQVEPLNSEDDLKEPDCKQVKVESPNSPPNLENTKETSPKCSPDDSETVSCSISINFHDNATADKYKPRFLTFISSFSEFQVQSDNDLVINLYKDENSKEPDITPKKRKKHSKVKKELFVVDATPSEHTSQGDLRYNTKFVVNTEAAVEEKVKRQNSRSACFNCGDPHALKDCLVPKDYAKIALARQKFKFQNKTSRYHTEDAKFDQFKPGKISSNLRKALGLQRNEAPHYIYLMRKLGYPPGWLEEAKFVYSNLDMFDIDGKFVKSSLAKKRGLDEEKIVEYPGFNVPFQKGTRDEHNLYRVPPYSENYSKKAMISFFDEKMKQQDDLEACDMDIDHALEPKPLDRNSPSLVDLEQQKRQLLEELNDEPKETKDFDQDFLAIKTSCVGTPLLKSNSPYSCLPNPDNFSKDVSPVINFENLPNSTGKYEQLTDVLQKVRDTLKKVQDCST